MSLHEFGAHCAVADSPCFAVAAGKFMRRKMSRLSFDRLTRQSDKLSEMIPEQAKQNGRPELITRAESDSKIITAAHKLPGRSLLTKSNSDSPTINRAFNPDEGLGDSLDKGNGKEGGREGATEGRLKGVALREVMLDAAGLMKGAEAGDAVPSPPLPPSPPYPSESAEKGEEVGAGARKADKKVSFISDEVDTVTQESVKEEEEEEEEKPKGKFSFWKKKD